MSRIGKKIIDIPDGVNITISDSNIITSGPKGELSCENFSGTTVVQSDGRITVAPIDDSQASIQYWGIQRTLLNNNIIGVTEGYKKVLEINRPFDVMFLGMGEDGHFASLFPSMIPKANCFNMSAKPEIIYTEPIGRPCYKRVSMNLSLIMESKKIILLVSNEKKAFIVNEAYENKLLPIHFLLTQQRAKIEIVKAY